LTERKGNWLLVKDLSHLSPEVLIRNKLRKIAEGTYPKFHGKQPVE